MIVEDEVVPDERNVVARMAGALVESEIGVKPLAG